MSKSTKIIVYVVSIIFISAVCLSNCLGAFDKEDFPPGDYVARDDYAPIFEVPNYRMEGLEITTLHEGEFLYIPEGYDDLHCEMANRNGEIISPSMMMCLVEIYHRGERVQGWVIKTDIRKNRFKDAD